MLPRAVPASLTQRGGDKSRREERGAGSALGTRHSLTLPGARPAPSSVKFPLGWQNHHQIPTWMAKPSPHHAGHGKGRM